MSDMDHILGRRNCISGLRKDLVDIQASVLDVLSRTGPVCRSSWKFPDKSSFDLDMLALLEKYDYVENEKTSNQLSHVALLELIIDRLLFLLQSFDVYVEQLRCDHGQQQKSQKRCQSAGLVVKSYWNNLVKFDKKKSSNKTSQTIESSFTPCDACHQVQSVLWKTGNALVDLIQKEGLPSSLQPSLDFVQGTLGLGQMTTCDVAQLANEQLRDMCRLDKHLQDVRGTVEPLQERVTVAETELEKCRSQLERQKKEFEEEIKKHQMCNVQLDLSLRNTETTLKETQQTLKEEQQRLTENLLLEEKITSQENYIQVLESANNVLQEKVKTLEIKEEAMCKLQERVQQFEIQVFDGKLLLDKERVKYKNACRQQESMQVKQQSLLESVDALYEECEDLQRCLGNQEEKEVDLYKQLQEVSEEKKRLQVLLDQEKAMCLENQKEKKALETNRDELNKTVSDLVQVLLVRERLLVAFTELSPLHQAQSQGSNRATEEPAPTPEPAQACTAPQYNTTHGEAVPAPPTIEDAINHPSSPTLPKALRRHTVWPVLVQTAGVRAPRGLKQRPALEKPQPRHGTHGVRKNERGGGGEDKTRGLRVRGTARGPGVYPEAQFVRAETFRHPNIPHKGPRLKPPQKPWERQIPSWSVFSVSTKSGAGSRWQAR